MSFLSNIINEMRSLGRDVATTTEELFAHMEERIAALEARLDGKDTPASPPPAPPAA